MKKVFVLLLVALLTLSGTALADIDTANQSLLDKLYLIDIYTDNQYYSTLYAAPAGSTEDGNLVLFTESSVILSSFSATDIIVEIMRYKDETYYEFTDYLLNDECSGSIFILNATGLDSFATATEFQGGTAYGIDVDSNFVQVQLNPLGDMRYSASGANLALSSPLIDDAGDLIGLVVSNGEVWHMDRLWAEWFSEPEAEASGTGTGSETGTGTGSGTQTGTGSSQQSSSGGLNLWVIVLGAGVVVLAAVAVVLILTLKKSNKKPKQPSTPSYPAANPFAQNPSQPSYPQAPATPYQQGQAPSYPQNQATPFAQGQATSFAQNQTPPYSQGQATSFGGQSQQNAYTPPRQPAYIPPEVAYVVCVAGTLAGKQFSLGSQPGAKTLIGRDSNVCQIVYPPEEPGISRRHCTLELIGNREVLLSDSNSQYGTFVGHERLMPNTGRVLREGDSFSLADGRNTFRITFRNA